MIHNTIFTTTTQIFNHPFACLIAGPSRSGKSTLVMKILQQHEYLIDKKINKILYCYSTYLESFSTLQSIEPRVEFHEGLPIIDNILGNENTLIILDDLMREVGSDASTYKMFCIDSHHKSISILFMTQNLFPREKYSRTISLNCNYIILMNNPRDRNQVKYLARQVWPENSLYLLEAYHDAVENTKYGYLLLDLTQTIHPNHRLVTNILKGENRVYYVPTKPQYV